jgi:hypothetical protein
VTTSGHGTRTPVVKSWILGTAAVVITVAATAVLAFTDIHVPLPGRKAAAPTPSAPAPVASIGRPYALVEVIPHRGADGGRAAAEAAKGRLDTAGMPVRLVDSLNSDVLDDTPAGTGFWVLLQDGFPTVDAAQAFCTQWRVVAPKCAVSP